MANAKKVQTISPAGDLTFVTAKISRQQILPLPNADIWSDFERAAKCFSDDASTDFQYHHWLPRHRLAQWWRDCAWPNMAISIFQRHREPFEWSVWTRLQSFDDVHHCKYEEHFGSAAHIEFFRCLTEWWHGICSPHRTCCMNAHATASFHLQSKCTPQRSCMTLMHSNQRTPHSHSQLWLIQDIAKNWALCIISWDPNPTVIRTQSPSMIFCSPNWFAIPLTVDYVRSPHDQHRNGNDNIWLLVIYVLKIMRGCKINAPENWRWRWICTSKCKVWAGLQPASRQRRFTKEGQTSSWSWRNAWLWKASFSHGTNDFFFFGIDDSHGIFAKKCVALSPTYCHGIVVFWPDHCKTSAKRAKHQTTTTNILLEDYFCEGAQSMLLQPT